MASRVNQAYRLYKFKQGDLLTTEGSHLPESYKKFFREWKLTKPKPVHYVPPTSKWVRDEATGQVKRVQDVPIPVIYPPESHLGIWGGEGVIKGFQKRNRHKQRVPHFWVPNLKKSAVYSEILAQRIELTLTERTIDLIIEHNGFDHYILKTPACDLQSGLALKLKRAMLKALHNKSFHQDNPKLQADILRKYQHYLEGYSEEDIEWYGLTFEEALKKAEVVAKKANDPPVPLKHVFRAALIQELASGTPSLQDNAQPQSKSWIEKLNPFSKGGSEKS